MEAGIIVYRRRGSELHARWSHSNEGGRLANGRAVGVDPGALTGNWPVEFFDADEKRFFSGYLESVRFGECFKLTWRGRLHRPSVDATLEGIGIALDGDTLCASFERVKPKAPAAA